MLLAPQQEIDSLASRIQAAYARRGARWDESRSTSRVWAAAATVLWQCRSNDPDVPVDPELFVASQTLNPDASDPWSELASPRAAAAYRARVHRIIRQLRNELDRELQHAEVQLRDGDQDGDGLAELLLGGSRRLSPLSRYILARRACRPDLTRRLSRGARGQYLSCSLYGPACHGLLSKDEFPASTPQRPAPTLPASLKLAPPSTASLN